MKPTTFDDVPNVFFRVQKIGPSLWVVLGRDVSGKWVDIVEKTNKADALEVLEMFLAVCCYWSDVIEQNGHLARMAQWWILEKNLVTPGQVIPRRLPAR